MDVKRHPSHGLSDTLRLLRHLMSQEPGLCVGWLLSLLAAAAAMLAMPLAVRRVVDQGFSDPSRIHVVFALLLSVGIVLAVTTATRLYFVSQLGDRVVTRLRKDVFWQLLNRSLDFHHNTRSAELLSRLTTDAEYLRILVGSALSVAIRSIMTIVGAAAMLMATSPKLAAWALVAILLAVIPIIVSARRQRSMARESQDLIAKATAVASEVFGAIRTVKEFVREPHESTRYTDAVEAASRKIRRRVLAQAAQVLVAIGLVFGAVVFVMWVGAQDVAASRMSAGVLAQFVFYAVIGGSAVAEMLDIWTAVQRSVGGVERLAALYEFAPSHRPVKLAVKTTARTIGRITFEGVDFAYASMPDKPVLTDFSLHVQIGECVALVGPSGGGKSTVFLLLMQLYKPVRGRILIDGQDLADEHPEWMREHIAIVPQVPVIFAASARENIRYGRLDATDAEVEAAAVAAEADGFIRTLPNGYDEPLGERGVRLSGGQQQRIAIARAMLKDAPILLLDEATSALDAQSERAVQVALERIRAGRTTLVIAHRLSTVMRADRIAVISDGSIVGCGTHQELVDRGGLYADLARLQFLGVVKAQVYAPTIQAQCLKPG